MNFVSQTLSLVGMLALAALVAVVAQAVMVGVLPVARILGALAVAGLCFWGAGWAKRRSRGD